MEGKNKQTETFSIALLFKHLKELYRNTKDKIKLRHAKGLIDRINELN